MNVLSIMATVHNYVPTPMEALFAHVTWDISLVMMAELAMVCCATKF